VRSQPMMSVPPWSVAQASAVEEQIKDNMKLPQRRGVHRGEGAGPMVDRHDAWVQAGGAWERRDHAGCAHHCHCDFGGPGLDARPLLVTDRLRPGPMAARALSWPGSKPWGSNRFSNARHSSRASIPRICPRAFAKHASNTGWSFSTRPADVCCPQLGLLATASGRGDVISLWFGRGGGPRLACAAPSCTQHNRYYMHTKSQDCAPSPRNSHSDAAASGHHSGQERECLHQPITGLEARPK
jgi:hypothetical protein